MTRLVLAGLFLAAATAGVVFLQRSTVVAQEGGAAAQPFQGKFLSIVKRSSPMTAAELEKVSFKKVEGRTFMVGTGIDVDGNWQKGQEVWIAYDEVLEITVFATLEQFKKGILEQPRGESSN